MATKVTRLDKSTIWQSHRAAQWLAEPYWDTEYPATFKEAVMLYEVAVVKKGEKGKDDEIIVKPVSVTASSELAAAFKAGSELGKRETEGYAGIEVIVRPFAGSR